MEVKVSIGVVITSALDGLDVHLLRHKGSIIAQKPRNVVHAQTLAIRGYLSKQGSQAIKDRLEIDPLVPLEVLTCVELMSGKIELMFKNPSSQLENGFWYFIAWLTLLGVKAVIPHALISDGKKYALKLVICEALVHVCIELRDDFIDKLVFAISQVIIVHELLEFLH